MADEADRADVTAVLAGEVDRFAALVRRWQGPISDLAYRYCRDASLAEDLAQEVFLRCYRSLPRWRGVGRFSTWLFAVALNVIRSELRRYRPVLETLETIEDRPANERPEVEVLAREEQHRLRRALLGLPEIYRDALVIYYFATEDVAAAAEILAIPTGTLKARLARGREALKRSLEETP